MTRKKVTTTLQQRAHITRLIQGLGTVEAVSLYLGLRKAWIVDCLHGLVTPLGYNRLVAALGNPREGRAKWG